MKQKKHIKNIKRTTLCYIEKDDSYLMLYRNKKVDDPNEGKWVGVGGKLESHETPDQCLIREVFEETGLTLTKFHLHGVVNFISDIWDDERMYLYTATAYSGTLIENCNEGTLRWIPKKEIMNLNMWEGDPIFLKQLLAGKEYIYLKLIYEGERLVKWEEEKPLSRVTRMLYAWIPHRVSNGLVINTYEMLRWIQRRIGKKDYDNSHVNQSAWKKHRKNLSEDTGYVEDQNNYTDMRYGAATIQFSGCEVLAVYNAIRNLEGEPRVGTPAQTTNVTAFLADLPALIAEFERDGMALNGKFGTAPKALRDFFERHGYQTEFTTKEKEFEAIAKRNDSLILTMYNDRDDITKEVHTVGISKGNGLLTAHNVYCNGHVVGPCRSVEELMARINGGRAKGISLIGIRRADAQAIFWAQDLLSKRVSKS